MRKRFKIDIKKVSTKRDLLNKIKGKHKDLRKLEGRDKSIYFYIKKTDFFSWFKKNFITVKTKSGKTYIKGKPKKWLKHEEKVLLNLSTKYKGKELYKAFLKHFPERPRSYSSVLSKLYRLRKKKS